MNETMKDTIKRKLTSRKFWSAVVGFVTPLLLAFGVTTSQATQITSIIMAGGALIAYIVGEGLVDSKNAEGASITTDSVTISANKEAQK